MVAFISTSQPRDRCVFYSTRNNKFRFDPRSKANPDTIKHLERTFQCILPIASITNMRNLHAVYQVVTGIRLHPSGTWEPRSRVHNHSTQRWLLVYRLPCYRDGPGSRVGNPTIFSAQDGVASGCARRRLHIQERQCLELSPDSHGQAINVYERLWNSREKADGSLPGHGSKETHCRLG